MQHTPRLKKSLKGTISAYLISTLIGLGPAVVKTANAETIKGPDPIIELAPTQISQGRNLAFLLDNTYKQKLNLDVTNVYEKAFNALIQEGIDQAQDNKLDSINTFTKAIKLYPEKTQRTLMTLDDQIKPLYRQAMEKTQLAQAGKEVEKKKKSNWLPWAIGAGAALITAIVLLAKKKTTTIVTPTYEQTTQTGTILDNLTNNAISDATITYSDIDEKGATVQESATTNANGTYEIKYKKGTYPQLTISHSTHVTRTTYPKWGYDYMLIPNSFDMETFNQVVRIGGSLLTDPKVTRIWTTQPKYYIVTDDMDARTKSFILDVLSTNEVEILTNGKIKGTTKPEEGPLNEQTGYISFKFVDTLPDNFYAGTSSNYDSNYNLTKAVIMLNINKRQELERVVILHELGHALGHLGHGNKHPMLMGDHDHHNNTITQWDIDNGKVAYSRPPGNSDPDNDSSATGAPSAAMRFSQATSSSLFMPSSMSFKEIGSGIRRVFSQLKPGKLEAGSDQLILGADLNNSMLYANLGNEKAGIRSSVSIGDNFNLQSRSSAYMQNKNFAGNFDVIRGNGEEIYSGAAKILINGVKIGLSDTHDARNKLNLLGINLSSPDDKANINYRLLQGNNAVMHFVDGSATIGKIMVTGSYGKSNTPNNPTSEIGIGAQANLGDASITSSYRQVDSPTMPFSEFNLYGAAKAGTAIVGGGLKIFRIDDRTRAAILGNATAKLGPGNLNLGAIYDPGSLYKQFDISARYSINIKF